MNLPDIKYLSADYVSENPTWDAEDSPWKADNAARLMAEVGCPAKRLCEVGCGAGGVLVRLREHYPDAALFGFDIAPHAATFWPMHSGADIHFRVGDFLEINQERYDVIFLLDVIEHLRDPFQFLDHIRRHADYFVFHFPLELSAMNVLRENPLLRSRKKVGHIHYFTKGLALSLLKECGYETIKWQYTNASLTGPGRTWKTALASLPRRMAYAANKDVGVRLLGGETLLVIARPISSS